MISIDDIVYHLIMSIKVNTKRTRKCIMVVASPEPPLSHTRGAYFAGFPRHTGRQTHPMLRSSIIWLICLSLCLSPFLPFFEPSLSYISDYYISLIDIIHSFYLLGFFKTFPKIPFLKLFVFKARKQTYHLV